jgi:poly(3-hydroxyalkanoate) synthetase
LTNNRGTLFSFEHVDPKKNSHDMSSDYWDFSFHEMAKFDVTANINYIKNITQNEKINYVCHSQGCTQFLLGYSLNPEFFEENIEKFGTMGAVLKYTHIVIIKFFINLIRKNFSLK